MHFSFSRYDKLLNDAKNISLKSAMASAFGVGLPYLLMLVVLALTVWLSAKFVQELKIEPGFVMQVSDVDLDFLCFQHPSTLDGP
jgi:hypothetical protein